LAFLEALQPIAIIEMVTNNTNRILLKFFIKYWHYNLIYFRWSFYRLQSYSTNE
jgi:hypothetical protein